MDRGHDGYHHGHSRDNGTVRDFKDIHSDLCFCRSRRLTAMDVADAMKLHLCLTPQLIPQRGIDAHLRLGRPAPGQVERDFKHAIWLRDGVDDAVLERLLARPAVRLKQHLACDAAAELEAGQGAYAVKVQAEIDGGHAEEAARRVHDAVVVREGKGPAAAKDVARDEGDGGEGEVDDGVQQRIEAVGIGVRIRVHLGEVQTLCVDFLSSAGGGRACWEYRFGGCAFETLPCRRTWRRCRG